MRSGSASQLHPHDIDGVTLPRDLSRAPERRCDAGGVARLGGPTPALYGGSAFDRVRGDLPGYRVVDLRAPRWGMDRLWAGSERSSPTTCSARLPVVGIGARAHGGGTGVPACGAPEVSRAIGEESTPSSRLVAGLLVTG
jgi:hypothetical protein